MSRAASPLRDRMIFLVGARRSGTNWLQRVVGAHPDVALVPSETYLFSRGIAPLRERFHHGVKGSPGTGFIFMEEADLLDALRDLCDRALLPFLEAEAGATRLAERTPEHVTCLDLIGQVYPDAHVVHIVRDGRDVARSLLSQGWKSAPTTVEDAAREWQDAIEAAEAAEKSLEHYRTVRYEELLTDPATHVADLYSWLGLKAGEDVLRVALEGAEFRFNVDPTAPDVAVGKWRDAFTAEDVASFRRVAGETLERLGYDPTSGGTAVAAKEETRRRAGLRRLVGRRDGPGDEFGFVRKVSDRVTDAQRLVDQLVASIVTKKAARIEDLTTPSVRIRFVGTAGEWQESGTTARARLVQALASDEALSGRQVRGDLHAALPSSAAVFQFETADGLTHARVMIVTVDGDRASAITYYQSPPTT
ncbi:MAG: sulfotransferase [Actinomycetota bacterium]